MTVKQWLNRGYRLNNRINELLEKKQRAFEQATSITVSTNADKVQTTQRNSAEERFVNYAAYEEIIDKEIDELYGIKLEIHQAIDYITDPTLKRLMSMRYEQFMSWKTIATELNYHLRYVYKLHSKALNFLEKLKEGTK